MFTLTLIQITDRATVEQKNTIQLDRRGNSSYSRKLEQQVHSRKQRGQVKEDMESSS